MTSQVFFSVKMKSRYFPWNYPSFQYDFIFGKVALSLSIFVNNSQQHKYFPANCAKTFRTDYYRTPVNNCFFLPVVLKFFMVILQKFKRS